MPKLVIEELPETSRAWITQAQLKREDNRGWGSRFSVKAGDHSVTYEYEGEIRFGPFFYRVQVSGPHGDTISGFLKKGNVFYGGEPFDPELNWYVLEEFYGENTAEVSM